MKREEGRDTDTLWEQGANIKRDEDLTVALAVLSRLPFLPIMTSSHNERFSIWEINGR